MNTPNDNILELYGNLETHSDGKRMVVRIMGHRIGTSDGWFHMGGMAIMMPAYEREDNSIVPLLEGYDPTTHGLAVDFYLGRIAVVHHGKPKEKGAAEVTIKWEGSIFNREE